MLYFCPVQKSKNKIKSDAIVFFFSRHFFFSQWPVVVTLSSCLLNHAFLKYSSCLLIIYSRLGPLEYCLDQYKSIGFIANDEVK